MLFVAVVVVVVSCCELFVCLFVCFVCLFQIECLFVWLVVCLYLCFFLNNCVRLPLKLTPTR